MEPSGNLELNKLFKEMYLFENERKNRLIANLAIPIAVLSLIFGVMTKYMDHISIFNFGILTITFALLFGAASISIIVAVILFACSLLFYSNYKLFPTPEKITTFHEHLKKHYEDSGEYNQKEINALIKNDLRSFVDKTHKECLETNIRNNDRRALYLHGTFIALILAILFLILSSFPYYAKYWKFTIAQKTEFINSNEGEKTND